MTDLSRMNPTERFSGLADVYARCRPDYPPSAISFVMDRCRLGPGCLVVDVGCGTGISSRLFAQRGCRIIGIEPNADMRQKAVAEAVPPGTPVPEYRDGSAEATGLPNQHSDLILAAQAFHWFSPQPALAEFHRVLKPNGWTALLWNERDETDPFTAAVGAVMRTWPKTASVEGPRTKAGEALLQTSLFGDGEKTTFDHGQDVDEEGLIGRVFSASYAPREPALVDQSVAALRDVFNRFQQGGRVTLRYQTTAYTARRHS
jgi:SAM-dependent methyltransferase